METSTCTLWRMGSPSLVLYGARFGDRAAHHPGAPGQEIATFMVVNHHSPFVGSGPHRSLCICVVRKRTEHSEPLDEK